MEQLFVYFRSSLLLLLLMGCTSKSTWQPDSFTQVERDSLVSYFEIQKKRHFQGSVARQAYYDTLISLAPDGYDYYNEKSVTHSKFGDYHIAFPLLEKAIKLNAKESLYYTAWLMTDLYKDYDRALKYLNTYDSLYPDVINYSWGEHVSFLKGEVLQGLDRHAEAIDAFTKAIEDEGIDGVDSYAFVYRGISFSEIGESQKAIADFDQAIALFPNTSMAYYYKGLALLKLNKKQEALSQLTIAKSLVEKGYKKTDPYKEVYNEIYLMQVNDKIAEVNTN